MDKDTETFAYLCNHKMKLEDDAERLAFLYYSTKQEYYNILLEDKFQQIRMIDEEIKKHYKKNKK